MKPYFSFFFLTRFINSLNSASPKKYLYIKNQIFLLVLACNYKLIAGHPGIVESNIDLKKFRENREKVSEAISTKLASAHKNNLYYAPEKSERFSPIPSPFQPMHLTRDDVVTSMEQPQETAAQSTTAPAMMNNNGGVIFAISQGHNSQPSSPHFTSAGSLDLQKLSFLLHS